MVGYKETKELTLFGYFPLQASYSDSYAAMLPSGQKQMLLVRVLVGRYCRGAKGTKMCPLLPGEKYKRYNTLVGWAPGQPEDPANPPIFVVDKGSMAYPAFRITYRHSEDSSGAAYV